METPTRPWSKILSHFLTQSPHTHTTIGMVGRLHQHFKHRFSSRNPRASRPYCSGRPPNSTSSIPLHAASAWHRCVNVFVTTSLGPPCSVRPSPPMRCAYIVQRDEHVPRRDRHRRVRGELLGQLEVDGQKGIRGCMMRSGLGGGGLTEVGCGERRALGCVRAYEAQRGDEGERGRSEKWGRCVAAEPGVNLKRRVRAAVEVRIRAVRLRRQRRHVRGSPGVRPLVSRCEVRRLAVEEGRGLGEGLQHLKKKARAFRITKDEETTRAIYIL